MIDLIKVEQHEKTALQNLLSLYLHDLSQFTDDLEPNEDGLFEYDAINMFMEDERLHPFFIKLDNKIIGFILMVQAPFTKPNTEYGIQELFILRQYRKKGLVQDAVNKLLSMYKGIYSVFVLKSNKPALHFWHRFYEKNEIAYEEADETHPHYENCVYQIFTSK